MPLWTAEPHTVAVASFVYAGNAVREGLTRKRKRRPMSIIRRHKTENYSVISNHCHRNQSLSAKAKGIFAYIMTLPDDWKLYQTELATHFSDGKDSIRAGIQELIKAGYMTQTRVQDESGKMAGWEYDVMEYPPADLPIAENPLSVNPPLLSTEERPKTKKNTLSGASIESQYSTCKCVKD